MILSTLQRWPTLLIKRQLEGCQPRAEVGSWPLARAGRGGQEQQQGKSKQNFLTNVQNCQNFFGSCPDRRRISTVLGLEYKKYIGHSHKSDQMFKRKTGVEYNHALLSLPFQRSASLATRWLVRPPTVTFPHHLLQCTSRFPIWIYYSASQIFRKLYVYFTRAKIRKARCETLSSFQ